MKAGVWLAAASLFGITGCAVVQQGDPRGVVVAHSIFTTLEQRNQAAQTYCGQFGRRAVLQATVDYQNSSYACVPDQRQAYPSPSYSSPSYPPPSYPSQPYPSPSYPTQSYPSQSNSPEPYPPSPYPPETRQGSGSPPPYGRYPSYPETAPSGGGVTARPLEPLP